MCMHQVGTGDSCDGKYVWFETLAGRRGKSDVNRPKRRTPRKRLPRKQTVRKKTRKKRPRRKLDTFTTIIIGGSPAELATPLSRKKTSMVQHSCFYLTMHRRRRRGQLVVQ